MRVRVIDLSSATGAAEADFEAKLSVAASMQIRAVGSATASRACRQDNESVKTFIGSSSLIGTGC